MTRRLTINIAIATGVFFAFTLLWKGNGITTEAVLIAGMQSLIFALFYAAIQVAIVLLRNRK